MFDGPEGYQLADWRRRINDIYARVRAMEDPYQGWRYWHDARTDLFRSHPMSPLPEAEKRGLQQIAVFPYDPDLRFEVGLKPVEKARFEDDLGGDGVLKYSSLAKTAGLKAALGAELTVYWIEGYGGGLFIPFRDASSGQETFGGGRYVVDAIKGSDLGVGPAGGLLLDFNFAYNPSCAFNDAYVCPLSPPKNRFETAIRGGEQMLVQPVAKPVAEIRQRAPA